MKLFIVILVMNHISGVMGPVPFGSTECRQRARLMQGVCAHDTNCPPDAHFICQWSSSRPVEGTPQKEASVPSRGPRHMPS